MPAQPAQLRLELFAEVGKRPLPRPNERELALDERDRRVKDAPALVVGRVALPPLPELRPRLLCLRERYQLVEREAEQIAEPDQLLKTADVRVGVLTMRAFAPRAVRAEKPELLVVANRAGRGRGTPQSGSRPGASARSARHRPRAPGARRDHAAACAEGPRRAR